MRVFVRTALALAFLPILTWAFIGKLAAGIKDAFWYAYTEVRIEIGSFAEQWRKAGLL